MLVTSSLLPHFSVLQPIAKFYERVEYDDIEIHGIPSALSYSYESELVCCTAYCTSTTMSDILVVSAGSLSNHQLKRSSEVVMHMKLH